VLFVSLWDLHQRLGSRLEVSANLLLDGSPSPHTYGKDDWPTIPFYVVGQGTASALSEVRETYGSTKFTPEISRGEPSGTGEKLAQFILDEPHEKPKKLLYLTGDKNRDTVPRILEGAGIELRSLKVYETQGSTTFERDLTKAMASVPPGLL
jgi:uroporphyrinogen-III synthase